MVNSKMNQIKQRKEIDKVELIQYINTDIINFVAYVITPFHVIGVKSFLRFLKGKGFNKLKGIIVIGEHIKNGYILNIEDIELEEFCEVDILYYKTVKLNCKEFISIIYDNLLKKDIIGKKANLLFVIHQAVPWVYFSTECIRRTNYFVIDVVTDDGLSSHFGILHWAKMHAKDRNNILYGIKYIIQRNVANIVRSYYSIRILNFSFFSKERLLDEKIINLYRETLENESVKCGILETEKYILYLSQPFDDTDKVWKVANNILLHYKQKGYKVYIKMHPREVEYNIDVKVNAVFLSKEFSIESIIAHTENKPSYIIGWSSSSLVTLAAFWNLKCYTLYDYLPVKYQGRTASDFIKMINEPSIKNKYVTKLKISDI